MMASRGRDVGREGVSLGMSPPPGLEEAEATDRPYIWEASSSSSQTAKLLPLGRIFGILFAAQSTQLEHALAQNISSSQQQQKGQVGKAVFSLSQLVKHMVSEGFSLDQVVIPILDNAVKTKDSSHRKKSSLLLRWLLQNDAFGVTVTKTMASVLRENPGQNGVKLGWCLLVRETLQSWVGQDSNSDCHRIMDRNLNIFTACVSSLLDIVSVASVVEGSTKVPTRLAIAAADCLLMITKCLTVNPSPPLQSENFAEQDREQDREKKVLIIPVDSAVEDCRNSDLLGGLDDDRPGTSGSISDSKRSSFDSEAALWDQLDNLIAFVTEMREWNDKERPLFGTGLRWLHNRLLSLASYRDAIVRSEMIESEGELSVGAAVLAACWEHFAVLLVTQDKKLSSKPQPVLFHWLGALQYYSSEMADSGVDEGSKKALEMRAYALACLAVIVGRLDAHHLELVVAECEADLLKAMFDQIRDADSNIEDLAVALMRAVLFRRSSTDSSSLATSGRMDSVVPMLLDMLDARDVAAKAVVLLVAEYFAANQESAQLEQLFSRLDSEESGHRRNALDVLTELFSICTKSEGDVNLNFSHTIATHLFKRLGDAELSNRKEVSALFAKLDPSFTLPKLLEALYSPDGRVRSAASVSVLAVLKDQRGQSERVVQLLDCTSNMLKAFESEQDSEGQGKKVGGRRLDIDRVMHLLPDWAASVEDWEGIINVVVKKMLKEPENAVIPRFLSSISVELAGGVGFLFPFVLDEMRGQAHLTQSPLLPKLLLSDNHSKERDCVAPGKEIFQRLSPLLVLRVLPLSAFNNRMCKDLYGNAEVTKETCITELLLNRMCGAYEYDEVRKVASELVGRLLPDVMIPLVTSQLRNAVVQRDLLRVKACMYAICVSLGARGQESLRHPSMYQIRQLLTSILVWPTAAGSKISSDVGKVQHGCIDSLAMMVCAELQEQPQTVASPTSPQKASIEEKSSHKSSFEEVENSEVEGEEKEMTERTQLNSRGAEIKFVTVLPESEQLKSHPVEERKLHSPIDVPTAGAQLEHKRLAGKRQLRLIEELDDKPVQVRESNGNGTGDGVQQTVMHPVIDCLTGRLEHLPWLMDRNSELSGVVAPLAFRLCMANVLISTCQKVALANRGSLASMLIPTMMSFIETSSESKLRGACIQVLFTAVYHLKAPAVLPFGPELFSLAIAAIRSRGLLEERLNGVKLLAALLASEEVLVSELAPYFGDAEVALSSIGMMDSSPELRMLCEKLLSCLLPPSD